MSASSEAPACGATEVTAPFEWASGMHIHRCGKCRLFSLFGSSRDPVANAGRTFLDHGGGTGVAYAAAQRLVQLGARQRGWLSPGGLVLRIRRDAPLAEPS